MRSSSMRSHAMGYTMHSSADARYLRLRLIDEFLQDARNCTKLIERSSGLNGGTLLFLNA